MTAPHTKPPDHPFAAAAQKSLVAFYRALAGWITAKDSLTVSALLDRIAEESGYATWLRDGTEEGEDRWSNRRSCAPWPQTTTISRPSCA